MCQFNCVPISTHKLFTYSCSLTAKLPLSSRDWWPDWNGNVLPWSQFDNLTRKSRQDQHNALHKPIYNLQLFFLQPEKYKSTNDFIFFFNRVYLLCIGVKIVSSQGTKTGLCPSQKSCIKNMFEARVIFCHWLTFYNGLFLQNHSNMGVCWPEVRFQPVDWAWNQKGITLLFHSGLTWFTYNSLLIGLDHQLILCSQGCVELCPTLSLS